VASRKNIIQDEEMFNITNPTIILVQEVEKLERALGLRTLRVPEVRKTIYKHMVRFPKSYE
jgi:hypothetical protein